MFFNNLKLAFRNILRHPGYSFLNLGGLALGLASSFLLLLYVKKELTYERHFEDAGRICRVATDFYNMGGFANSQEILHSYLKTECKDVAVATRLKRAYQNQLVSAGHSDYQESGVYYIDSAFFQVFSYPFVEGDPSRPYLIRGEVILTEETAHKYFGEAPAWGQTIRLGKDREEYQVAGVVQAKNDHSHLKPALFLSVEPLLEGKTNWSSAAVYNYVKLSPGGSPEGLAQSLERISEAYVYPASGFEGSFAQWKQSNNAVRFFVQPLQDIYLYSKYKFEVSPGGNPQQVYILGIVGLFIILIAGVNYVNLTTARASVRAKEVGVKKTFGAGKGALVYQFLGESVGFSLVAMLFGLGLSELLLLVFERISGLALIDTLLFNGRQMLFFGLFAVIIGLLAGIYPAFYLTAFKPSRILKGTFRIKGNAGLRGGLVVFQFTIAIVLMIASWVVYQQLQYMHNKDLGFRKEGVLIIGNLNALKDKADAFREALRGEPQVVNTSNTRRTPAGNSIWMYTYKTPAMEADKTIQTFPCDDDFLKTLGMELIAGRDFHEEMDSAGSSVILNERAVQALGLEDPIGAIVNPGQRVVGVVRDFHYQSLREGITPVVLQYSPAGSELAVRLGGNDLAGFLTKLQSTWSRFSPEEPLKYHFLDDNFAALLEKERILGRAVAFFTILAIIIACLGLFGLAVFTATIRTKEIGIRKILGASVASIVQLLSRDFLKLVLIATVMGIPLAWWAMHRWLEDFAFRIDLRWWMLAIPCLLALLIALTTVSFQAIRAATANPVKALRYE